VALVLAPPAAEEGRLMTVEPEVVVDSEAQQLEELDEESRALAPRWTPPPMAEFDALQRMSQAVATTQMIPGAYRGKPDEVLAAFLTARELGLAPMFALRHIFVIDGKPTLSSNLQGALVRRAGHRMATLHSDEKKAVVWGRRRDTGDEVTVTWTVETARRAALLVKQNWKGYVESMLVSRAQSQLVRELFQDVTMGIAYTPEEAEDISADAFNAAPKSNGQVERKSGDRQEAAPGTTPPPVGNEERYLDQKERDDLKAFAAASRELSVPQFISFLEGIYRELGEWNETTEKSPLSSLRVRHANLVRERLQQPPRDPDEGPSQGDLLS
jgi:hypothetical protein